MTVPTTDQFTAALKYLGWQGGTVHQVMAAVEVSVQNPPIPIRRFDFLAQFKGQEEGPQGWGRTRDEAIADLFNEVEWTAA
jgi:hypothetical protein